MGESSATGAIRRRTALGALAFGASAGTAGCMRRLRAAAGWQSASPVSLEIKTLPADADPYALRVSRAIAEWFRAVGLQVDVTPMAPEELYRQVLLRNEFDAFVAPGPTGIQNGDALYALLHSRFSAEPGWQNPFGYANLDVDDSLETQRSSTGAARQAAFASVQRSVARTQPFSVVAFPDEIRAVRSSRFSGWHRMNYDSPLGYLSLDEASSTGADGAETATEDGRDLRVVMTDRRPTENLNPLAVEFRWTGILTGLLYDSLGYETRAGHVEPWLADTWEFTDDGNRPRARVRLRSALTWHDETTITAEDAAFTYALLSDVTLGQSDEQTATTESGAPVAAPRFRGRSSLVADAEAVDTRTVEVQFTDCTPAVATRAFTVPVFPEHIWAERGGPASIGGLDLGSAAEILVTNNIPPVGSGPVAFERNVPGERLVLDRFDDHFLATDSPDDVPARLRDGPAFDRITVDVVGSDETAVSMVANDGADVTGTAVGAATVPRIGRSGDLDLVIDRSSAPYIVGYNTRRRPLTNPRFRNTLAHLIDQQWVANDVFDGYAWPAASPLAGTDLVPGDLEWDEENPVTPFFGSDGRVDVERAREAFRDVGYEYEDGTLVERN
jgi:peptide/nickel transport system substrate-binding protein